MKNVLLNTSQKLGMQQQFLFSYTNFINALNINSSLKLLINFIDRFRVYYTHILYIFTILCFMKEENKYKCYR